jgi:hypothetical protein
MKINILQNDGGCSDEEGGGVAISHCVILRLGCPLFSCPQVFIQQPLYL